MDARLLVTIENGLVQFGVTIENGLVQFGVTISNGLVQFGSRVSQPNCLKILKLEPN